MIFTKQLIINFWHWCGRKFELEPMVVSIHTILHSINNNIVMTIVIKKYSVGSKATLRFSQA
jgi:hypothetical protein